MTDPGFQLTRHTPTAAVARNGASKQRVRFMSFFREVSRGLLRSDDGATTACLHSRGAKGPLAEVHQQRNPLLEPANESFVANESLFLDRKTVIASYSGSVREVPRPAFAGPEEK
jgi:hypothetical protein